MNIHAVSHSLPHRGPGASRARTRWQPYAPNVALSNAPRSSSPAIYLHTPASSVSSLSPASTHVLPLSDPERLRSLPQQLSPAIALRDAQKTKYAAKLVDQAVKSLCETWHPDDIPTVFTACGRESLCAQPEPQTASPSPSMMAAGFSKLFATRAAQLPSPVTPTTRLSPSPPANGYESYSQALESSGSSNLIPIRGFVHEVLRRSRTSTGVLQTALCYLEAVRSKVPDLLRKEKARPTTERYAEDATEPRIVQGLYEQENFEKARTDGISYDHPEKTVEPALDTVRVDHAHLSTSAAVDLPVQRGPAASRGKEQDDILPPLPPLPSPLCCPRRTFLACLILASKFMQDRSYSNRAWAKLAGLPPREIGRCERAVGEALEWRLWVGKLPSTPASTSSGSYGGRTVSRTQSDGDLLSGSAATCISSSTAAWATATAGIDAQPWSSSSQSLPNFVAPIPTSRHTRTVQRSATVPVIGSNGYAAPADPFLTSANYYDSQRYCEAALAPGFAAFSMNVDHPTEVSPALSTPTLSYSPMSCSSSSSDGSEERTIQMSMFVDLPTPSPSCAAAGPSSGPWVANPSIYPPADPANPYGSNGYNSYLNHSHPMYDGADAADIAAETSVGPTLAAIDATKAKAGPTALPSFAEAFSGRCPGMLGYGTR